VRGCDRVELRPVGLERQIRGIGADLDAVDLLARLRIDLLADTLLGEDGDVDVRIVGQMLLEIGIRRDRLALGLRCRGTRVPRRLGLLPPTAANHQQNHNRRTKQQHNVSPHGSSLPPE